MLNDNDFESCTLISPPLSWSRNTLLMAAPSESVPPAVMMYLVENTSGFSKLTEEKFFTGMLLATSLSVIKLFKSFVEAYFSTPLSFTTASILNSPLDVGSWP